MQKTATAVWSGGLKDGKGTISTQSGVLAETPYTFATRFENHKGTNPEELIGAAHAGCFTMALSAQLEGFKVKAERMQTIATVTLEQVEGNWTISKIHLDLTATIPGITAADFQAAADKAKANCPVSRLFKAEITLDAKLG
jgi:osmotically inducible protein OsmC